MTAAAIGADAPRRVISGSIRRSRRWALIASYFFLILFAIFFLVPPYYQLATATKTSEQISNQDTNPWLPALSAGPSGLNPGGANAGKADLAVKIKKDSWLPAAVQGFMANISQLMNDTDFPIYFRNTAIVTVCVVIITMLIAVPAAFSLGRMKFWGSGVLATGVFLTYLVPDSLLFIPLFKVVGGLGLLDSYWGLVLVYPTLTVPFCTWIMIGYFQSIPKELDEAALIDGANHIQMLFKIFIPVALPGLIAATIFAFTVSWAAFVYPMAFIYSSDQLVLTAGTITSLVKADVYQWGMIMTAALLAAAPPLVIYAFLMDYYIAGLTAGATKG
ncbi:MAG TPA: carbohydrate ABC transporter permease [Stellaceae bacterium]|nr:carbohydrate ABC transporter permease [Stellaceae bacterium]